MQDQHGQPADPVNAEKLLAPHREHRRRRKDLTVEIRAQAEREERTVVENPRRGQLDQGRRAGVAVRPQRILQVARVQEAVLREQPRRRVRDLVEGRAVADGPQPGDLGQDRRAAREDRLFLLARLALERFVEIPVMTDLVPATVDLGHHVWPALRRPPGNEERRLHLVPVEEVQDQRHAHLGAIRALRHHAEPFDVRRVARDPRRLRVEIERDGHGRLHAAGPGDRRRHEARIVGQVPSPVKSPPVYPLATQLAGGDKT